MKKSYIVLGFGILVFGFITLAIGCGQQSSTTSAATTTTAAAITTTSGAAGSTTTTSSATTTTVVSGTIIVSGQLAAGTISGASVMATAASSLSSYTVVGIKNSGSQTTYIASVAASGNWSLAVPVGISLEVSLVDNNSKYFGPVVMAGSGSTVTMAIKPTTSTNLGQIVVDSSKSMAKPTDEPTTILDASDTAYANNGVPLGCGEKFGTEKISGVTLKTGKSDQDQDGIPDYFDGDKDNDGVRNGITSSNQVSTDKIENAEMTAQLLTTFGRTIYNLAAQSTTSQPATSLMNIRLTVIPISDEAANVQSVVAVGVPESIKESAKVSTTSDGSWQETYPAEGTSWQSEGYKLYKHLMGGETKWMGVLRPYAWPQLGDTFLIRVTYNDATTEDLPPISFAYVMKDVSKITSINSTTPTSGSDYNDSFSIGATNSALVVWSTPRDESNDVLAGLVHYLTWGTTEGTVPTTNITTLVASRGGAAESFSYTINDLTSGANYYIMPYAATAGGMRSGEEFWFRVE